MPRSIVTLTRRRPSPLREPDMYYLFSMGRFGNWSFGHVGRTASLVMTIAYLYLS